MEIRQLCALIAVDEHGTFSAAADAMHTVQSNVSAHIARLEKELGVVLVDRGAARLTREGETVAHRARRVVAEVDAIGADVAALRNEVAGEVRLGVIGTAARWLLPQLLSVMQERYPLTDIRVSEGTTSVLEPQLTSGGIDMAIVLLPMRVADVTTEPLFEEDMLLLVEKGNPLANETAIDMKALASTPLLLPPVGTSSRAEMDDAARADGVKLISKAEIDGVRLTASLTFDGHGPAILPATALPSYLQKQWSSVYVNGLARRLVGLAQQRRAYPTPPARALKEVLLEVVAAGVERNPGLHPPTRSQ